MRALANGYPLLHTAGELMRTGVRKSRKSHKLQVLPGNLLPLRLADILPGLQRQLHVPEHVPPRQKTVVLKNRNIPGRGLLNLMAVNDHGAGRRRIKPGNSIQQGALAASGRSQKAEIHILEIA